MNLPNKLTILRIVLVPIILFIWLFPYASFNITFPNLEIGNISLSYLNIIVLVLFCLASFTDYLDGNIARKKNLITTFGKFADPIADKLLTTSMFLILGYKHMLPILPIVLMIVRDIVVDGCRMIAAQNGVVVAAGILGKLKTVLQMVLIIITLLNNLPFELYFIPVKDILCWFTAFISVLSGYTYYKDLSKYIFESI